MMNAPVFFSLDEECAEAHLMPLKVHGHPIANENIPNLTQASNKNRLCN